MEHNKEKSMWVVKVGGSLLGTPELKYWLDIIAKYSDGKFIIVPGGGLFADAVREAQQKTAISDACAHVLAAMAMDQYGMLLASLNASLATAHTEMEIDERTWQHRGIVWIPSQMVLADDSITKNWDATSDSIAAWLANKLSTEHLVLLKSMQPEARVLNVSEITKMGLVDTDFAAFVTQQPYKTWVLGKDQYAAFADGVSLEKLQNVATEIIDEGIRYGT
jgi:5-(aminomethyl)-3-furanmethanol phosphate kinase